MCTVLAREPFKIVVVDKLRWEFLQLEEMLWNSVLDYGENNIRDKEDDPEVMLVKKFGQFGDRMTNETGEVCKTKPMVERRSCIDMIIDNIT